MPHADWIKPVLDGEAPAESKPQHQPFDITALHLGHVHAKCDITLAINDYKDSMNVVVAGDSNIFVLGTIQRMAACLEQLVHTLLQSPDALVEGSIGLAPQERTTLADFSAGKLRPEYLDGPLFHEAFAEQAAQQPARRCLVFEGAEMSYGEVSAAVNSLACGLAGMGVGPGSTVGIMVERSFELVIAILGVLQAGGGRRPAVAGC